MQKKPWEEFTVDEKRNRYYKILIWCLTGLMVLYTYYMDRCYSLNVEEWFAVLSFDVLSLGLMITWYQVRQVAKSHRDNHEWNRMKAAQDIIMEINKREIPSKYLTSEFELKNKSKSDTISFAEIEKILEKPNNKKHFLEEQLNILLNSSEFIAVGIHQGVYDSTVIKNSRKTGMIKYFYVFKDYIDHRRARPGGSKSYYEQLEALIVEWEEEDREEEKKKRAKNKRKTV